MPGGRNNTQRIETLESQAANLSARLDVYEIQLKGIIEGLTKGMEVTAGHTEKIIVFEEKLLVLADFKNCLAAVTALEKEFIALKKDLESLGKWKDELKKEKDEVARRFWAFGPNFLAALVSGAIAILGVLLSVGLTYWLRKP
jgi:hypothetical protein